jgi:nucleoside-diphosphate-sugar epimerase
MRILVTGANGLVGSALCREGLRRGHEVHALCREGANTELVPARATLVRGEFHRPAEARRLIDAVRPEAILHAAAVVSTGRPNLEESLRINVAGTRTFADAAREGGVARWLQVSSMSAHAANRSIYGGTKYLADRTLEESGIPLTIFRPSLVYAAQRRGLFDKMVRILSRAPVVPLIGFGNEPVRPIHADDLAWAFGEALSRPEMIGRTYQLGGADAMTFREMIERICRALGRSTFLLPIPLPICRLGALVAESLLPNPPATTDNIEGIIRAQEVDNSAAERDLVYAPRGFEAGLRECLEGLRGTGDGGRGKRVLGPEC